MRIRRRGRGEGRRGRGDNRGNVLIEEVERYTMSKIGEITIFQFSKARRVMVFVMGYENLL